MNMYNVKRWRVDDHWQCFTVLILSNVMFYRNLVISARSVYTAGIKMADKDFNKHRLGFSLNYMNRPASENFPIYTTHDNKVRKHLTLEVSAFS